MAYQGLSQRSSSMDGRLSRVTLNSGASFATIQAMPRMEDYPEADDLSVETVRKFTTASYGVYQCYEYPPQPLEYLHHNQLDPTWEPVIPESPEEIAETLIRLRGYGFNFQRQSVGQAFEQSGDMNAWTTCIAYEEYRLKEALGITADVVFSYLSDSFTQSLSLYSVRSHLKLPNEALYSYSIPA